MLFTKTSNSFLALTRNHSLKRLLFRFFQHLTIQRQELIHILLITKQLMWRRLSVKNDNFFDSFMFGKKNARHVAPEKQTFSIKTIEKYFENVNLDELANTIDNLMSTAEQLKPYYSQISPLIKQFLNKK